VSTGYACPRKGCCYRVARNEHVDAVLPVEHHRCPSRGSSHLSEGETMTLVQKLWALLDIEVAKVLDSPPGGKQTLKAQGAARALSEALFLFVHPVFDSADAVGREGIRRAHAIRAGEDVTSGWEPTLPAATATGHPEDPWS